MTTPISYIAPPEAAFRMNPVNSSTTEVSEEDKTEFEKALYAPVEDTKKQTSKVKEPSGPITQESWDVLNKGLNNLIFQSANRQHANFKSNMARIKSEADAVDNSHKAHKK